MSVIAETKEQCSLRAEVVEAGARWSAGQHRLVRVVAALDESGEWALDGAPTCAHWVADALDVEVCTAREWVRIGRALEQLEVIDAAFSAGRLSYSKVRAVTRVATLETQTEVCTIAQGMPAGELGRALALWQAQRETPAETERRQHAERRLWWRIDVDGMVVGAFRLAPNDAATVTTAIDTLVRHRRPDASADAWPSIAQQRADALADLASGGAGEVVTEIVMHIRGDGCSLDDGTPLAESVVERIAPEAFLRVLIHDAERRPINASGRQRHPTTRQRRVVRERDRSCADCGSTQLLEYDHNPPFEQTKRTIVDELVARCANCHHRRHPNRRGG